MPTQSHHNTYSQARTLYPFGWGQLPSNRRRRRSGSQTRSSEFFGIRLGREHSLGGRLILLIYNVIVDSVFDRSNRTGPRSG
jgi:hypothetical protein